MKYRIEIEPLADHSVVAAKDWTTGVVKETFSLNESGVDMLRLFCEGDNTTEVSRKISEMYDAPLQLVSRDVLAFYDKLRQKDLIENEKISL